MAAEPIRLASYNDKAATIDSRRMLLRVLAALLAGHEGGRKLDERGAGWLR